MDDKELRDAVRLVVNGDAKMGEVCYGDDGVDMARDIARALADRDRYRRALEFINGGLGAYQRASNLTDDMIRQKIAGALWPNR